jgi:hypothetical protein
MVFGVTACGDPPKGALPSAEFLLATGDSTYWVRASAEGLSVRSSPLLLTWDGQELHELFVTDDEVAWPDAVFLAQRLWRRSLISGDSIELASDSVISPLVGRYRAEHPGDPPLSDDEPLEVEPTETASSEFEILDAHGPYISWVRHLDVDVADSLSHRHERSWRVSDVRTGATVSCSTLFGAAMGARFGAASARAFDVVRDSMQRVLSRDSLEAPVRHGALRFDPHAFSLSDRDGDPRIIPMIAAPNGAGQLVSLALPFVDVPAPHPAWWRAASAMLPRVTRDSTTLVWTRPAYVVIGNAAADHDRLTFALGSPSTSRGREQVIATLPGPAWSVFALDEVPLNAPLRRALARAFDDAQQYGAPDRQLARLRAIDATPTVRLVRRNRVSAVASGRRPPTVSRRARRATTS